MLAMWLDDIRKPPVLSSYLWVKTASEAIELLKTRTVTFASLDHDLGPGLTGYDVINWMEEHNVWQVHSQNPVGRERMQVVINKAYGEAS